MFIIFLDIDGILLHECDRTRIRNYLEAQYAKQGIEESKQDFSTKAYNQAGVELFNESALAKLDLLIAAIEKSDHKIGIVISSGWKHNKTVSQLKILFGQHNFSRKIIDKTCDAIHVIDDEINFSRQLTRGEEIDAWLQENTIKFQITNYLILDDIDYGISELFKNNFVLCKNGILDDIDLIKAIGLINQTPAETKESYLVNKLESITHNQDGSELSEKEVLVRVSLEKRKCYITSFFKTYNCLSDKTQHNKKNICPNLVIEYEGSSSIVKMR